MTTRLGKAIIAGSLGAVFALALAACEGSDNPVALSSLNPQVTFEIHAPELETFEEIEIHVRVMEGGSRMNLREAVLEMTSAASGATKWDDTCSGV